MKKLTAVLLLIFMISCNNKHEKLKREGEPEVIYFEQSDNEMNSAIEKAKETLPEFQKALLSNNPNYSNFALKQEFQTSDGGGEHIWIGNIQLKNGKYYGLIQNQPVDVKEIKQGDSVEVAANQISDWMYDDKNVVKGAYTVKVMRKYMSDEERKQMDAEGFIYE